MSLSEVRLREIVSELASRPQHEKVRALISELLVNGLGASSTEIDFERQVPEVHGRIDALLGRTLFEFKSDLRREQRDAESKLPDYLYQRESETGMHFVGIATDGATFIPYELRASKLASFETFTADARDPHALLAWLSSVVAVSAELEPDPEVVQREMGRSSLAWNRARHELESIWNEIGGRPDVRLKRDLWAQLMRRVYGAAPDEDALFLQHTYLTIVAKTMAAKVLGVSAANPAEMLSGLRFEEAGIGGAVESDFFDWPLASGKGPDLVRRVALQAGRFRLEDVQTDVLKGLYESLIDPEQRHFLGEYYTPDWLAQRICAAAIEKPLDQRVLDPACGSGTFVFHAVRRLLEAAEQNGMATQQAITRACSQVFGIDVHPVAVQIARVTFLLAIGQERLKHRPASLNIPVYMGDSLQWNTRGFMAERDVLIEVPESTETLEFPFEVTRDPALFDSTVRRMLELSEHEAKSEGLTAWLQRDYHLSSGSLNTLAQTYDTMHKLHRAGRDHIWGFVTRNLVRPIWLAQPGEKVDVVVGNPPWLSYRYMDADLQKRFRAECQERGLWAGGKVATHQDLSAYFFARSVELYLKASGSIAFVMPFAAMSRRQFEGFRSGVFAERKGKAKALGVVQAEDGRAVEVEVQDTGEKHGTVQFTEAWVFSDDVQPLFPVPSCVLFGHPIGVAGMALPATVRAASGVLPKRDASPGEASGALVWKDIPWPSTSEDADPVSVYSARFKQGATIVPRVLSVVEYSDAPLGSNRAAPVVQSVRTGQQKLPWKRLGPLRGNIEKEFLRPLYLGDSVAPFRSLGPGLAVIPWASDAGILLDSQTAQKRGYAHLAAWLTSAELLWAEHGQASMTLVQQIDYFGKLSAQFPIAPLRVVYSASGTLPAAALLSDDRGVVEHKLYWTKVETVVEGRYLLAILNSETARKAAEHLQSRGQWGARDFDKVILSLPIPKFDSANKLDKALAKAASRAEQVAAAVPLEERMHFVTARQKIRAALQEDGVAAKIDKLVADLLGQETP